MVLAYVTVSISLQPGVPLLGLIGDMPGAGLVGYKVAYPGTAVTDTLLQVNM